MPFDGLLFALYSKVTFRKFNGLILKDFILFFKDSVWRFLNLALYKSDLFGCLN
jgi:hypothetical protein